MGNAAVGGGAVGGLCGPGRLGRMGPRAATLLPAALTVLLALSGAEAQERPPEGDRVTITGTVLDAVTRQPIEGVSAEFSGMGYIVETDAAGRFTLSNIQTGDYRLELWHPDYQPAVGDFTIMRSGEFETFMEPVFLGRDELITGIVGVVSDIRGGSPIDRVSVYVEQGRQGALTDTRGRFLLDDLLPGLKSVRFSALGYVTRTEMIDVEVDRVTNLHVSLSPDPVELDPIEVTVERREIVLQDVGFYTREADGFGAFIDREEIEMRAPAEMTDLFTRIPGADLRGDAWNPLEKYVILRGGRAEGCFPRVVLDGVVVAGGGDAPAALDQMLDPQSVAGVEVYPSSTGVPIQYAGTGASCGLIVIWTRR